MSSDPPSSAALRVIPRWLGTMQWATALGIVAFWVYFFAVENRRPDADSTWLAFERSFPVADLLWLTPLLGWGGWSARRGRATAIPCALAAGGAMVFLGLLDASFNLQQGRYTLSLLDGLLNGFINVYCVVFGVMLIRVTWRGHAGAVPSAGEPANGGVRASKPPQPTKTAPSRRTSFAGRHVAITGGSSGIGLATGKKLAARGAHVVILARDRARLDAAAAEIDAVKGEGALPCLALSCDVADADQVAGAFEAMAKTDRRPEILINSAGLPLPGYFERQPVAVFERQMQINYFGTLHTIKHALPAMMERGQGHIVNISSVAGFLGVFGYSGYAASKFAVWGLSEVLRGELRPRGIAVSVVCPPDTDTPQWHEENKTKPLETKAIAGSIEPLSAEYVADAILEGVARRRFCIIPGFQSRLLPPLLGVARPLVHWVLDRKVARAATTADAHG